jgi:hypothetical protein
LTQSIHGLRSNSWLLSDALSRYAAGTAVPNNRRLSEAMERYRIIDR